MTLHVVSPEPAAAPIDTNSLPSALHTEEPGQAGGQAGSSILAHLDQKARARFEDSVDRSGGPAACHHWLKSCNGSGYGRFSLANRASLAHRVAWVIHTGKDVPPGAELHHHCNARSCVNPAHLEVVDHAENMKHVVAFACAHDAAQRRYDSLGRAYCIACLRLRARAHHERCPVDDLSHDCQLQLLECLWMGIHEGRGLIPSPISTTDRKHLSRFLRYLGERRAFLSLWATVERWDKFAAYAERNYGVSWGRRNEPPRRPILAVIAKNPHAAGNFWSETDPREDRERRRQLAQQWEQDRPERERLERLEREREAQRQERYVESRRRRWKRWMKFRTALFGGKPSLTKHEMDYLQLLHKEEIKRCGPALPADFPHNDALSDEQVRLAREQFESDHPEVLKRIKGRLWILQRSE